MEQSCEVKTIGHFWRPVSNVKKYSSRVVHGIGEIATFDQTEDISWIFFIIRLPLELLPVLVPLEQWRDAYTLRGPAV